LGRDNGGLEVREIDGGRIQHPDSNALSEFDDTKEQVVGSDWSPMLHRDAAGELDRPLRPIVQLHRGWSFSRWVAGKLGDLPAHHVDRQVTSPQQVGGEPVIIYNQQPEEQVACADAAMAK
jgi:hypothetical protein